MNIPCLRRVPLRGLVMNKIGNSDPLLSASNSVSKAWPGRSPDLLGIPTPLPVSLRETLLQRPTQSQHLLQNWAPRHLRQSSEQLQVFPCWTTPQPQSFIMMHKDTRATHSVLFLQFLNALYTWWRWLVSLLSVFGKSRTMKRRTFTNFFILCWKKIVCQLFILGSTVLSQILLQNCPRASNTLLTDVQCEVVIACIVLLSVFTKRLNRIDCLKFLQFYRAL